jgi:hypothetical protein
MGLFKGALTVRRYEVDGDVPPDFRTSYGEAMANHAFREPMSWMPGAEVSGWVLNRNLLETDFTNLNDWLHGHYLTASLRVDKKVIPTKLFRAHLDQRLAAWCAGEGREKAPASIRTEMRELLELEMAKQTLPRVAVHEFCWNVVDGWVLFHSCADSANDRFRKLFRSTFGLVLLPNSPLSFLGEGLAEALEVEGVSDYRPVTEGA